MTSNQQILYDKIKNNAIKNINKLNLFGKVDNFFQILSDPNNLELFKYIVSAQKPKTVDEKKVFSIMKKRIKKLEILREKKKERNEK